MFNLPVYLKSPAIFTLFMLGLGSTAILTPFVMRLARKLGAVDSGGYRKVYEGAMPLLGGLGIAIPMFIACLTASLSGYIIIRNWEWIYRINRGWLNPLLSFASDRHDFSNSFVVLAIGGIAIVVIGMLDDVRGLRMRVKLLGQVIIAVFICVATGVLHRIYIPLVGSVELGPATGALITILWIVGLINAFNLIDGIDGLAAGIALIASVSLSVLGAISGNAFMVITCTVLAGSLLAFLAFNFHPARIFLGDSGSMFLGYILATVTLIGTYKSEATLIILAPMLALGFPIFETMISMLRRYVRGVPIYVGDNRHTHHRLLSKGYSQRQVVLMLYAVSLLLGVAAVMSRMVPEKSGLAWIPPVLYVGTLIGIAGLADYLRPSSFNRVFRRRQRATVMGAFSQYAILSLGSSSEKVSMDEIMSLCRRELRLRFLEAWFENGPSLICSGGKPIDIESEEKHFNSAERLRINSLNGQSIVIRYQFDHHPDRLEREEVTATLARIFEHADGNWPIEGLVDRGNGCKEPEIHWLNIRGEK